MTRPDVRAARCEALFASGLQQSQHPSDADVHAAIQQSIRKYGLHGCLARVAGEFGEHPETAVVRMRWANQMVSGAYQPHAAARLLRSESRKKASAH
jgi:hypothetical protein